MCNKLYSSFWYILVERKRKMTTSSYSIQKTKHLQNRWIENFFHKIEITIWNYQLVVRTCPSKIIGCCCLLALPIAPLCRLPHHQQQQESVMTCDKLLGLIWFVAINLLMAMVGIDSIFVSCQRRMQQLVMSKMNSELRIKNHFNLQSEPINLNTNPKTVGQVLPTECNITLMKMHLNQL